MAKVSTILDQIDNGSISLPVFQRGYVWNRKQVRDLFTSLYREYPVGSLLVWETASPDVATRGDLKAPANPRQILLDGQQRITSLYGVMRGRAPAFFDGNAQAFQNLRFHLEQNQFEFYQPVKMRNDPLWIDVSTLYKEGWKGINTVNQILTKAGIDYSKYVEYIGRLLSITDREIHVENVTGEDMTLDVVVEIFNRVNSGGTKLTHGDLALAKIGADWPAARETMQSKLLKWRDSGYNFSLDWLLRVMNSITTGRARFVHMHDISPSEVQNGLIRAEKYIDKALNMISSRIGLDHDQVLFAKLAIPILVAFLNRYNGDLTPKQRDRLLYWYAHAGMWGRYSGPTETTLDLHLSMIKDESPTIALDELIGELRRWRGGLEVEAEHFKGSTRGNRFYSVIYLMTRMEQALDLYDGLPLKKHQHGKPAQLELHHIFPKGLLYDRKYDRRERNALANFCFLTQGSNRKIGYRSPSDYLAEVADKNPGALESQWIPIERDLWEIENYKEFLEARRELLAKAANELLDGLLIGRSEPPEEPGWDEPIRISGPIQPRPASIADEEEENLLLGINEWMKEQGLPGGILGYEIADQITGEQLAMFDLAWPEGVQSELSEPVAILIDESMEVLVLANRYGYRCFVNKEDFQSYINDEILTKDTETELQVMISKGETKAVEFKSSLRINLHTDNKDSEIEHAVLKTLAGFMNTKGGTLLIGVDDNGTPIGTQADKFNSEDKMIRHLVSIIKDRMESANFSKIHMDFETYEDYLILKVVCEPYFQYPGVWVNKSGKKRYYIRAGTSTIELTGQELVEYMNDRYGKQDGSRNRD